MIETYGKWCFEEDSLVLCEQRKEPFERPVYEVIRMIDGIPLFFHEHMTRLKHSLELLNWNFKVDEDRILGQMVTLFEENKLSSDNIRLEIGQVNEKKITMTLFCVKGIYPEERIYQQGVKLALEEVLRENPHAKVYRESYAQRINQIKKNKSVYEVVLHHQNRITEGSKSNLFFIKENKLFSAKSEDILLGISRGMLIGALDKHQVVLEEKDIFVDEIAEFEACFLTGTSIHLLPIAEISGVFFDSANHPLYNELRKVFEVCVKEDLLKTRRRLLHG